MINFLAYFVTATMEKLHFVRAGNVEPLFHLQLHQLVLPVFHRIFHPINIFNGKR
jgi:hypothetical protein